MRASGRLLRRLAQPGVCAACEGWSRDTLSALIVGEVGACVRCRELSGIAGSPFWCTRHTAIGWRLYSALDHHLIEAHGGEDTLVARLIPRAAGPVGARVGGER